MLDKIQSEGSNKFSMFLSSFCHLDLDYDTTPNLLFYYFIGAFQWVRIKELATLKSNNFDLELGQTSKHNPCL